MVKAEKRAHLLSAAATRLALAGLFAGTACANLFGVGELTSGSEEDGGAPSSDADAEGGEGTPIGGSRQGSGQGTGGSAASLGGSSATRGGRATSVTGGAGRQAVSENASGAGQGDVSVGGVSSGGGGAADAGANGGVASRTSDAGAGGSDSAIDAAPPSCRALDVLCGTSASATRDCCATSEITGGEFFRSYDNVPEAGWDDTASPARVATFRLDIYEVTVGRFRRFVEQYGPTVSPGAGRNQAIPGDSGWREEWSAFLPTDSAALARALESCAAPGTPAPAGSTWTAQPDVNEALPVNCVTWFEAYAFCAWDGGRLPTEAEWNYAAAGGSEARVYPWPSSLLTDIDGNHAVYDTPIAPVGSKSLGRGRYGQADLAGNVWEWNVDWYRTPYRLPCDNCAELTQEPGTVGRVLRGGGYYNMPAYLRAAERGNAVPSTRDPGYGFRCARED